MTDPSDPTPNSPMNSSPLNSPRLGNRRVASQPAVPPEIVAPVVELVAAEPGKTRKPFTLKSFNWRIWTLGSFLALLALAVGAWFALPIKQISVTGHARLSEARVLELAGLQRNFGWLYYGHWRAKGLLQSPWVQSAVITRQFPDRVTIAVTERQPVARWQRPDSPNSPGNPGSSETSDRPDANGSNSPAGQLLAVALDGTVMPGAEGLAGVEKLPLIQGWGPERLSDALKVLGALSGYNVQSVAYTPTGLTVKLAAGSVWSGDLNSLLKYAGSISMYPNKTIHIYPWGVSVQ